MGNCGCERTRLWPDMAARVKGESCCVPPFTETLSRSLRAFLAVSVPNAAFATWFETVWGRADPSANWEVILALDRSFGTHETEGVLDQMFLLQERSRGRLAVRLLTPGALNDAQPRISVAILDVPDAGISASVGSSRAFGVGVPAAGDVNLWVSVASAHANAIREVARAYWETAAELTQARCEIPLLDPCRGNAEGERLWAEYEDLVSSTGDLFREPPKTIQDLPLKPEGGLDEAKLNETGGAPLRVEQSIQSVPEVVAEIQELYEKGSLISVQQEVKPLSVPIPPSIFGQRGDLQIGAVRHEQRFRIDLFDDEETAKEVEKLRKRTTELVKLFSFSFGRGKYWVPKCAMGALNRAIDSSGEQSQSALGQKIGGDLDHFLKGRRPKIAKDLNGIYQRLTTGVMSEAVIDRVIGLLRERVVAAQAEGLAAKITGTAIAFQYSPDQRQDPWNDATALLWAIATRPREIVVDHFARRELKVANLSVPDYLEAMDVLRDALVALAREKGWGSAWVVERAQQELKYLSQLDDSSLSAQDRCEWLLSLICGEPISAPGSSQP